ncbi:hypothetical protein FJT64_027811 [Amphibalanus amphitrite]|uniref:Uncharacterized protein n=1 Tax=Amphibalanus amphitrite TaxID=1232801 RepID=A0A6A4VTM2_AMPAM|nr:hypothetical protein FJT64_027811 [Amphibalanus amphitrite]
MVTSIALLVTLFGVSAAIVIPPETLGDDAVAIVIVQGTYVYPEQYVTLGVIMFASYLTTPLAEYPVPVLHLSGTLDGTNQTHPHRLRRSPSSRP